MKLCSIASGSSGNCIYVGSDTTSVLIDAGISGKRIEEGLHTIGLTGQDIDAVFITHEHSDHIKGLGVLARKRGIPIYATRETYEAVLRGASVGKIPEGLFHEICPDRSVEMGDLIIEPFSISHDAANPVGYRVNHGKQSMAVATDLGVYGTYTVNHLKNLDVLLLEANHDIHMLEVGTYPYYLKQRILGERGHLSNEMAGQLLCEVLHDNMKQIVLGHLSRENNYPALAYETVCAEVTMGDNPYKSGDFHISVAKRDSVGELIEI
ncbi:MAG TPA: MBL fold metallo-hydrolase [Candidatus Scatomonas pullistercoris]|uniref:MBL fold metallo-hydrolase n=1 Tax=Candidatus Scatomonas pullistercoris TaxID=2840920 RepID=A0A9D1P2E3_9FIRM|nr:MBL fold metallo-hydrolase [Candidatus Scatomonas pullistercoris]